MENKPQADSSRKSPVSKSPPPEEAKQVSDGKVSDINVASKDQTLDSKESYQETKTNVQESEKVLETTQLIEKKDIVTDNSLVSDDKLSHTIISVDIQKSLPCDTKESVPCGTKQDSKQEANVPPEVLASVVTTAVVNEATLSVSETNGVANGFKVTKDSSKVDAVVEQELSKISDSKNIKTDTGGTKPMPNGDIDHSPVRDASSEGASDKSDSKKAPDTSLKEGTTVSEEQTKKDLDNLEKSKDISDSQSQSDEKVEKIEIGSRNGVPGIITVESITKRETISGQNESEKASESGKDISLDTDKGPKEVREEKPQEPVVEIPTVVDSKSAAIQDNLTDSAKLHKANLTDSAKIQSVSEPKVAPAEEKSPITKAPKAGAILTTVTAATSDDKNAKLSDDIKEKEKTDLKETDTKPSPPSIQTETKLPLDVSIKADTKEDIKEEEWKQKYMDLREEVDKKEEEDRISKAASKPDIADTEKVTDVRDSVKNDDLAIQKEIPKVSVEVIDAKSQDVKSDAKKESSEHVQDKEGEKDKSVSQDLTEKREKQKKFTDVTEEKKDKDSKEVNIMPCEESYDMTAMMTSQILTPADLGIEERTEEVQVESKDTRVEESVISATVVNGKTCDVAVGLDEKKMARVATADGEEEEVDGQQASAEVVVSEDTNVANGHEGDKTNGTEVPSSPISDKASTTSKPDSAGSKIEDSKKEEEKPASAVSRTSIPEATVYEPPERRKSATSVAGDSKKDPGADKSQLDEKESEKKDKVEKEDRDLEKKSLETTPEGETKKESDKDDNRLKEEAKTKESIKKEPAAEKEVSEEKDLSSKATTLESNVVSEKEAVKEKESFVGETVASEKGALKEEAKTLPEKPEERQKDTKIDDSASSEIIEKDSQSIKSEPSVIEESGTSEVLTDKVPSEGLPVDSKSEEGLIGKEKGEKDAAEKETAEETAATVAKETESKTDVKESVQKTEEPDIQKIDKTKENLEESETASETKPPKDTTEPTAKVSEPTEKPLEPTAKSPEPTENPDVLETPTEPVTEESADAKDAKVESETKETLEESTQQKQEAEGADDTQQVDTTGEIDKVDAMKTVDVKEVSEEPKTLVEESKEKETSKAEEKDEDDTEKEATPEKEIDADYQLDAIKDEDISDNKVQDEQEEVEIIREESSPKAEEKGEDEKKEGEEAELTEEAAEAKEEDKTEPEEKEKAEEDAEKKEVDEKQDIGKEEEKPESPVKSPTKRSVSPTKGRRGISPGSPPKILRGPTSPTKPQKSSSPKKKNGMLSPVKTPKTPGTDARKLPPIKAPVGLAPNPNLKNIRSKVGSFDNIKYKPGGGEKKMVISKKLEWKAAPKVGSLDHTYKKPGKCSKGDSKEEKLIDGQSPLPSGDEGDAEGTASGIAETLLQPEGAASTEMPSAITAES